MGVPAMNPLMFLAASAAAARWLRRGGSAKAAAALCAPLSADGCAASAPAPAEHRFLWPPAAAEASECEVLRFLAAVGGDCENRT